VSHFVPIQSRLKRNGYMMMMRRRRRSRRRRMTTNEMT
jgi:hypothetical protein